MERKGLGLSQILMVVSIITIIGTIVMSPVLVKAGDTATTSSTLALQMGNNAPVVEDVKVMNSGTYSPVSNSTTAVAVRFNVTDLNGWTDIDLSSASTLCTLKNGTSASALTVSLSPGACTKVSNSSQTKMLVQCTGNMQFYYYTGIWNTNCSVTDGTAFGHNDTTHHSMNMTYTRLESVSTKGASDHINWVGVDGSSTNLGANDDPIVIGNLGNAYFGKMNITGVDMVGVTIPTEFIYASDFSVNAADAANGNPLTNASQTQVTYNAGATPLVLQIGASATASIYEYLEQISIPVSTQSFAGEAAQGATAWNAGNVNP